MMKKIYHDKCWICGGSGYVVKREPGYIRHKAPRIGRRPGEYVYERVTRVITRPCHHSKCWTPRGRVRFQRSKPLPNRHKNTPDKKRGYKNRSK